MNNISFSRMNAEDVEEVNLLQIVEPGGEQSGDHQRSKIYTDTFLVCIVLTY